MANPSCTSIVANTAYTQIGGITKKQQRALLIYANALQLAAIGGTDYTASLATTLLSDAAAAVDPLTDDDMQSAWIDLAFKQAAAAGASVPATMAAKVTAVARLAYATDEQLDQAELLLECKLGVSKAYPQ